jgi:mRNA-degrading endonuclease RelE of RelBE toxin-antitoxin system
MKNYLFVGLLLILVSAVPVLAKRGRAVAARVADLAAGRVPDPVFAPHDACRGYKMILYGDVAPYKGLSRLVLNRETRRALSAIRVDPFAIQLHGDRHHQFKKRFAVHGQDNYRIVYQVNHARKLIIIVDYDGRGDVYAGAALPGVVTAWALGLPAAGLP